MATAGSRDLVGFPVLGALLLVGGWLPHRRGVREVETRASVPAEPAGR